MENQKYLFLKFENAGFFRTSYKSKDFICDLNGKSNRQDSVQYVEPITAHHISNAFHVLAGERPSPSLRKTLIPRIDEIYNMVQNGYLKIDTNKIPSKYDMEGKYPESTLTLRKGVWNSFSTAPTLINWERVRRLLENDLYNQFITLIDRLLNVNARNTYTCNEAVAILREHHLNDEKVVDFIKLLDKKGKTPMIDYINGHQKPSKSNPKGAKPTFNANDRTLITTNFSVDKITRLKGTIIIPVNDFYIEKIRNNKGIATLLDGGLVWIDK